MDIKEYAVILGILMFFIILVTLSSIYDDIDDMHRLINVLKVENLILFPIGIAMLCYQIYKSGKWGLAPENDSYIVIMFFAINIITRLLYKFVRYRFIGSRFKSSEDEYVLGKLSFMFWFCLLCTPIVTFAFLIHMVVQSNVLI